MSVSEFQFGDIIKISDFLNHFFIFQHNLKLHIVFLSEELSSNIRTSHFLSYVIYKNMGNRC